MSEIIARIVRSNRTESLHRGHIAAVDPTGKIHAWAGEPVFQTYIRSAAKPFQIMPLLREGIDRHFGFTDAELAVIMASHNGEEVHIEAVKSILRKAGLRETDLKCAFHLPMHRDSATRHLVQRLPDSPIYNNCSGKHSGMLARARFHDWSLEDYLDPGHPVQKDIKAVIAEFADYPSTDVGVGVDGCSAPVFYLPIKNMAVMYAKLAEGKVEPAARSFEIMTLNPEMIAGTDRFDTDLMRATRGRMASKVGAEGVRCVAIRGNPPMGVALKIEDGNKRASEAVLLEALAQLNLISEAELGQLLKYRKPLLRNHAGIETGFISAEFQLHRNHI